MNYYLLYDRLIELDEAVEALDAAIEYKNYHIENHQRELRQSTVLSQVRWSYRCIVYNASVILIIDMAFKKMFTIVIQRCNVIINLASCNLF